MTVSLVRGTRRSWLLLLCTWLLVIASIVTWRRGVIFDGGFDLVVVGKAGVAALALGVSAILYLTSTSRRTVGGVSVTLVAFIIAISAIGALAGGNPVPTAVLVVRMAILAATIMLLVSAHNSRTILTTLLTAMAGVGLLSAATGFLTETSDDRLFGGIPPLQPNELAALILPPLVSVVYLITAQGLNWWNGPTGCLLLWIVYETGSRTGLAVGAAAAVLVLVCAPSVSRTMAVLATLAIPVAFSVVAFTDLLVATFARGEDETRLLTLNSRTVAWDAVLQTPVDTWRWWIGAGLALKVVPVAAQYRDEQVLDSSWISAIAQSGAIGTLLLGIWVLLTVKNALRRTKLRPIVLPLVALVLVRSLLENGLIESSVTFMLFFTLALLSESGTESLRHALGKKLVPDLSLPALIRLERVGPSRD